MRTVTSLLQAFWRTLRFIGIYMVANAQASMEYRVAFGLQVLTMAANDSLWLFFWWTFFRQFPLVNGWQSTDIIVIWSISAAGFGVGMSVFGNAPRLAALIMNGGLDAYIGMPRNVLLHVCVSATDPTAWGDVLFGLGAYVLFLHPNVGQVALFLLLCLMVALLFASFVVILGTLAFFLGNTEGMANQLLGALINFSTYPMNIFSGVVRLLLFTIIPAGFISFIPLQLLRHFAWPLFSGMIGFTALFSCIAAGVFQLGLRRYESGNLMGMQN
ncbi:MAG TPA: ABC-2 family transporter protein [Ktedonobacteraceae bacterium]|nr:ABC-2 family transporter protein [Ktedonobacteraceae bacterium]